MKLIESIRIAASQEKVYHFLSDLRNHEKLMPADIISQWQANENDCSFSLKNMIQVQLKIHERIPFSVLQASPIGEAPIAVHLEWKLDEIDAQSCTATYSIEADINMMMQMIAKPILTQLITHETETLSQLMGS